MTEAPAVRRAANLLGEPENEVYQLSKTGTRALLNAVSSADTKAAAAMASKSLASDAVVAYLDMAFLGPFLRSGKEIPFAENAGELGTYIEYLDRELSRGALHATFKHQTYLKLQAYVTAVEAPVPLAVFRNALRFLADGGGTFDFGINSDAHSAQAKLARVTRELRRVASTPAEFVALHSRLEALFDPLVRNAVSHSTYRVHGGQKRVDLWERMGASPTSRTFEEVAQAYEDARCYLMGFFSGVSEFAYEIHPDCPLVWSPTR